MVTAAEDHATELSVADAEWFGWPQVKAVFGALNREGHEARIVGGALRNTLMGLPAGDIDFAVTAPPDDVARLSEQAGLKPVPTGLDHGTITVVVDHMPFEVTTLRKDVETHGRHATVAFTRDWAEDAARRDFTMNALYAGESGQVFDPLGGLPDLRARRVRFIGSARDRIEEDFLRILRFFRFTADYSAGPPEPDGLSACIRERAGLDTLSAERVRMELLRLMVARRPMLALESMAETGLLIATLGGVVRLAHFERLAAIEAEFGLGSDAIRRLAALAMMVEEDAVRLATRLRLTNAETARLKALAALHPRIDPGLTEQQARITLYRLGIETYRDRALLAWARESVRNASRATDDQWLHLCRLPERWLPPALPLKGKDLVSRGMKPGPELGETLRLLEDRWIASDFAMSRDELLESLGADR